MNLKSLTLTPPKAALAEMYPFNIPLVRSAPEITFTAPVTFFVGENGSGKSTLLEAIACAASSITAGSADAENDHSLAAVRTLAKQLKLTWHKKTRKGFFLRSEDYFGYVKRLAKMRAELEIDLRETEVAYKEKSKTAQGLATIAYRREIHSLDTHYNGDLDSRSHGESYLAFFQARFIPGGLYLMDEPEAPLSPVRQLALISMLKLMIAHNAKFIIATHSPILMAFPVATLLNFDSLPP